MKKFIDTAIVMLAGANAGSFFLTGSDHWKIYVPILFLLISARFTFFDKEDL